MDLGKCQRPEETTTVVTAAVVDLAGAVWLLQGTVSILLFAKEMSAHPTFPSFFISNGILKLCCLEHGNWKTHSFLLHSERATRAHGGMDVEPKPVSSRNRRRSGLKFWKPINFGPCSNFCLRHVFVSIRESSASYKSIF